MSDKIIVILPTYNESETLPGMIARLRTTAPEAHLLVVDDSSPDGTGAIADALAFADSAVHVLHRTAKRGLGPAYLAGFSWALRHSYDTVVQSDADGSHRPEDLPALLAAVDSADLVIGSRWVAGGSAPGWAWHRLLLSRAGSAYAGLMLGLAQHDITGGYRVFRATALERIIRQGIASQGYCFQIEMLDRAVADGDRVVEVPITFDVRAGGESKMSSRIVREALRQVTAWGIRRRMSNRTTSVAEGPRREHAHV
ncbi:dolichol-phosphate mannosyltransferase [Microbacterium sp. W4I4]|uniref:polyprenol monophosphomannose synthase n=1 Tax=Microbacterium sp. W4I4 TaxID=3042295 RepID=UPI00277E34A7|nr:polyprenol monophosphomannose synthase [Microbacterium sp. W4I4]MDQ0612927.1 dolichol-phosphate mannosyltransferase [Microbacterium sp. W4I4]